MTGGLTTAGGISNATGGDGGPPTAGRANWRRLLPATGLVFLSFFIFSAVRAPVPAVNEPHYLSKAKHYWNPNWCRGDFFLESSNTHLVFYQTFGWPKLVPPTQVRHWPVDSPTWLMPQAPVWSPAQS